MSPASHSDAAAALELLRSSHRQQCRAELDRVHPSWWRRALQGESPAVRRVIAAHGPAPVRGVARADLGAGGEAGWMSDHLQLRGHRLDAGPLDRALVGGEPVGANDPPVIVALAGLPPLADSSASAMPRGWPRQALAANARRVHRRPRSPTGTPPVAPRRASTSAWVRARRRRASVGPAELDRTRRPEGASPRALPGRLGLETIARLLDRCEPFRTRWALQHVPYPIAKRIRSLMPSTSGRPTGSMAHREEAVLERRVAPARLRRPARPSISRWPSRADHVG